MKTFLMFALAMGSYILVWSIGRSESMHYQRALDEIAWLHGEDDWCKTCDMQQPCPTNEAFDLVEGGTGWQK